MNYKRGHVKSQPFPQQNQRKMPSENSSNAVSDGIFCCRASMPCHLCGVAVIKIWYFSVYF
ncbi:hypothetical protein NMA1298 [Neisseria meningitidis Z2491]|uniref:Uncharacterized protein n=1 Tax=Neisseria meningitidis serogroup A / serotype 4A (strain DSM 15465 / Z2491) TaxID=122587 RepID=A0A0U1RIU4_NEIMA|nr:hypothetical protein NMA1298 [Neisseria meningitidis Z2491]